MQNYIKTIHLYKKFKNKKEIFALEDISISIEKGEKIAIIGENGSGKSTLLKIICGLIKPSGGSTLVAGFDPFKKESNFLKKIGLFCSDSFQIDNSLKIRDQYLINKDVYDIKDEYFQKQLSFFSTFFKFKDYFDVLAKELSFGERIMMEVCLTLLHSPKIILLDEMTVGLDIFNRLNILNLLKEYIKTNKATCIFISHNINDAIFLADRILILDKGKNKYFGKLSGIKKIERKKIIKIILLNKHVNNSFLSKLINRSITFKIQDYFLEIKVEFKNLIYLIDLINKYLKYTDISVESEELDNINFYSLK